MSRIAKAPIVVPSDVDVTVKNRSIKVEGPKGKLSFELTQGIELIEGEGEVTVHVTDAAPSTKHTVSMSGTTRAIISNFIQGVSKGFERKLSIFGVGYRAQAQGKKLNLSLGFSHPIVYELPEGITAETPTQTEIVLRGSDKQILGQVAAEIRAYRPPEPYKGKGIRYTDEYVMRKQAKKK